MVNPIYQQDEELLLNPFGSKYLTSGTYTDVNSSEFVVQEDTIISVLTGGDASITENSIDYEASMNLSGVTLKKGALIVAPVGEAFKGITIDSGSIMAYNCVVEGTKPVPFDSDYQSILNYATTQAYTLPSESQKILQNQVVVDLKSSGVWNKLDVFYLMATDADSNFASINWKSPNSFELTQVNSPTFISNEGFQGNGVSSYLDTNYNPSSDKINLEQNNTSVGFWQSSASSAVNSVEIGTDDGNRLQCLSRWGDSKSYFPINSTSFPNVIASTSIGLFQSNRTSSSNINQFVNGAKNGTDQSDSSSAIPNRSVSILARNAASPFGYSSRTLSMAFVGENLENEASDFYNSINSYITSL